MLDEDDYKKLTRVMQYLRCTRELTLTIEPGTDAQWRVDSSYAVHPDKRSHSGVIMTLGKGVMYSTSCKQKLNTKSSMEVELVAIDNAMGQILWTRHFLAAQGLHIPMTTIFQDNKSTILLAENGSTLSSNWTRHLNVRYYFVTDKIKNGEIKIAYCPTKDMIGDFLTKPLQGSAFIRIQEKILNLPSSENTTVHRSVLRVDKNNAIHCSRKDMRKDAKDTDTPHGDSVTNCNMKWARGTKEGNRDDKASK